MKNLPHHSAKPSHYNKEVKYYDNFNEKNSILINQTIEKILKKYKVKTVFDLTCGTGSQVFWLDKRGYEIVGADFNLKMLKIAKSKAKKGKLNIKFIPGDMRTTKAGKFDAVITIANAVGHLTKHDFKRTMQNIRKNLNDSGLYIFDIFNLSYLLKDNNITKLTIDWQKKSENTTAREIQYSTISCDGILASYDIYHEQIGSNKTKISKAFQTLQVYSAKQLKEMLQKNGFKVLQQCNIDGSRFSEGKSDRILTIARKQ
ncbi:MAG: class I SAM-dependent methyltransferase [Pseudomonadota bacterium]